MEGIEDEGSEEDAQSQHPELPASDLNEDQNTTNNMSTPASSGPVDAQEEASSSIQNTQGSVFDIIDQDPNPGSETASSEPMDNDIENTPHHQAATAIQNTNSLEPDTVDQDMDHESTPVAPTTPETMIDEEELVEDAFYSSRRNGLDFDVMEREPGEVRAPAPPQPRARRWS
ncbi:MAG: hypothetical protein Q9221_007108 [Calogaya cf. arnoldii]